MAYNDDNALVVSQEENNVLPQCSICQKVYELDEIIVSTPCDHIFHKTCIVEVLKETLACPICSKACRPNKLRSFNILSEKDKSAANMTAQTSSNGYHGAIPKARAAKAALNSNDRISTVSREENLNEGRPLDDWVDFAREPSDNTLQHLINESVRNQLAQFNLNPTRNSLNNRNMPNRNSLTNRNINMNSNRGRRNSLNSPRMGRMQCQPLGLSSDKTSTIISSWQLKYSGQDEGGLSVDNFIYRIHALTMQSLNGDFNTLCRHIHLLFTGKANDWFWRFHRRVGAVDWHTLCFELRNQFRDRRTDFELKELIRNKKQKIGERFDMFYDSIQQISDRLHTPFSEFELVEILKRNLRPEVRKELLHFNINHISDLREFVRKHEVLEEELSRYRFGRNNRVSEMKIVDNMDNSLEELEELKELTCWNCSGKGHKFEDCVEVRSIFCYGCGSPNIFKPHCTKCNKFSKNYQAPRAPKPQSLSKATQY